MTPVATNLQVVDGFAAANSDISFASKLNYIANATANNGYVFGPFWILPSKTHEQTRIVGPTVADSFDCKPPMLTWSRWWPGRPDE